MLRTARLLLCLLLGSALLAGCTVAGVPDQQHPSCSWSDQPPDNADQVCTAVFRTVSQVAQAELHGDNRTVRRLVSQPAVAARIIAYGAQLRSRRVWTVHVVPSLTLLDKGSGQTGAAFFLQGETPRAHLRSQEIVFLQERHGAEIIVGEQPGYDW